MLTWSSWCAALGFLLLMTVSRTVSLEQVSTSFPHQGAQDISGQWPWDRGYRFLLWENLAYQKSQNRASGNILESRAVRLCLVLDSGRIWFPSHVETEAFSWNMSSWLSGTMGLKDDRDGHSDVWSNDVIPNAREACLPVLNKSVQAQPLPSFLSFLNNGLWLPLRSTGRCFLPTSPQRNLSTNL